MRGGTPLFGGDSGRRALGAEAISEVRITGSAQAGTAREIIAGCRGSLPALPDGHQEEAEECALTALICDLQGKQSAARSSLKASAERR